ncbi:filament-like plant protein isoform X2 [Abrus precatorius]|uniref:Filament-like plant protein isoform X2 n=1 Tax=Abrus precatorius TaxID=3816 RepID=A0A8B8K664_ABRPR|nr:filament-like plant protein isoform X2 [Abrus precatorius]
MEKKRWLWKRKSSEKSPGEAESSGSAMSHSERHSDERHEASKESPIEHNQSPDVTSKAVVRAEDINDSSFIDAQSPEVTSHTTDNINDDLLEEDENQTKGNKITGADVTDGLMNMSDKLSATLVNVTAKEDLAKQHAKVAEEAIAGWENAETEVTGLKKQLKALTLKNSTLEYQVTHLDSALKECVRQLRQTREEQEQNIHDAVLKKTHELESAKTKLENQLMELQSKSDVSNATSPSSIDFDMCQKVEYLEKENMALKHEVQVQSEKLEISTIERDLSTQAAEMASKQHLESINKVARLEAECRRLKSMASKASVASSSFCVESLKDSQSDSGERTNAMEIDTRKKSGSEPDTCELSCSDSWASALIAELDQFKNEKCRQIPSGSVKIDLMDDFLEMEKLAALPDAMNESVIQELVVANQCSNEESSIRDEFGIMNQQMDELKEKLEEVKAEKAELQVCLMKSEECIETSQIQMSEAETKLEELRRELENAYKSKQMLENELMSMQVEAQSITARVHLLEAEVDKEKAMLVEIASQCKELEEELERKKHEEKLRSITNSYSEMKLKQEDLALAAGKLAECQKTIASLGNQLNSLATLEDFLIDTSSIPEFSTSPSLIARAGKEMWKLHSNDKYSPKRNSSSSRSAEESSRPFINKNEESSTPSSNNLPNHESSGKSRNGFAKFLSQTESGIRLEM